MVYFRKQLYFPLFFSLLSFQCVYPFTYKHKYFIHISNMHPGPRTIALCALMCSQKGHGGVVHASPGAVSSFTVGPRIQHTGKLSNLCQIWPRNKWHYSACISVCRTPYPPHKRTSCRRCFHIKSFFDSPGYWGVHYCCNHPELDIKEQLSFNSTRLKMFYSVVLKCIK